MTSESIREALKSGNFLAITVDGYLQVRGKARALANKECPSRLGARLTTAVANPQLFSSFKSRNDASRGRPTTLIPINDMYSIYLDNQSTLRAISHLKDGTNTIGQPIIYGLQLLKLQRTSSESYKLRIETKEQSKSAAGRAELQLSIVEAAATASREIIM